jgi:hypothetical protein
MNKGLRCFGGEAVGFLNSDDRFADRNCLAEIAAALYRADITFGHVDFVADHISGRIVRQWRATSYVPDGFRNGWMPAHPTFYVRRNVVEKVGKFDINFRIAADYDYMLRSIELHNFDQVLIDRVLVQMQHGGASTRNIQAYVISNLESHRSRMRWLNVSPIDKSLIVKPMRKLPQFLFRLWPKQG